MSRADVLDPGTLEAFDGTRLPHWMLECGGCGWPTLTLGDRARHVNEDGRCPIEPLAEPGFGYMDEVLFSRRVRGEDGTMTDHIFVVRVHRLRQDGQPMMWFNGARHSHLCECFNESSVLNSESETA